MNIGNFDKPWHISRELVGYMHVQGYMHAQKNPLADLEFLHKPEIKAKAKLSNAKGLKMCPTQMERERERNEWTPGQRPKDWLVQGNV